MRNVTQYGVKRALVHLKAFKKLETRPFNPFLAGNSGIVFWGDTYQFNINIFNRKIIEGLLNDLKIKDENQRFKVLRAIDKYDRIDENFIDLLQKERVDPVSGDKITGANLSNDQAKLIIEFLIKAARLLGVAHSRQLVAFFL